MTVDREDLLILSYCIDGKIPEDIILNDTASTYLAMPEHGLNANESKLKLESLLSRKLLVKEISFDNWIHCGIAEEGEKVIEAFFHPDWQSIIGFDIQDESEDCFKVTLTSCDLNILNKFFSEEKTDREYDLIIKKCASWQPVYWKRMSGGFSLSFKLANTEENTDSWCWHYAVVNDVDDWIDSWDEVEARLKGNTNSADRL